MPLRSEHFITPIKLVLPGIIVSVIGLFASNYIFNDPVKIRGRNSRTAWDNLIRYEKIYSENSEAITCDYNGNIGEKYFNHLIHLQEMTTENLKLLRDDKDIDKLLSAIINLRIDTYSQLKTMSRNFFDTLSRIDKKQSLLKEPNDSTEVNELTKTQADIQQEFVANSNHIYLRDSAIIKNLGEELKKNYKNFKDVTFNLVAPISTKSFSDKLIGHWSLLTNQIPVQIEIDSTSGGVWTQSNDSHPFTWKLEDLILTIHFSDNFDKDIILDIIYCSDKTLLFKWSEMPGLTLTACRMQTQTK